MKFFDFFKKKPSSHLQFYSGGSGSSLTDAVIINASSSVVGIAMEHSWLAGKFGKENDDWSLGVRMTTSENGRHFDVFRITLKTGVQISIYFDITQFFGKF